jgi:hypothetical protein
LALKFNKQNEAGFPGINETTNDPEGGTAAPPSRIKAVYEYGGAFSVELKFIEYSVDPILNTITESPVVISAFTFTPYDSGVKCEKISDDTLKISGDLGMIFTDSVYNFVMPDRTVKALPPNTTQQFLTITSWTPPSQKIRDITHQLSVTYTSVGVLSTTESITISQEIHWRYSTAVAGFRALLAKGTI